MLDAKIRKWCQNNRGPGWHKDESTKWKFVLEAYQALNLDPPLRVRRAAMRDGTAGPQRRRTGPAAPRPRAHFCPISHEIMRNPVMCPDGHS